MLEIKRLLQLAIIVPIIAIIVSCAAVPKQVDFNKSRITNIKSVALQVTAKELDVRFATETGWSSGHLIFALLAPLTLPITMGVESASENLSDQAQANEFQKDVTRKYLENLLGDNFINDIQNSKMFSIEKVVERDNKQLLKQGNDAIIEIKVEELSLKRITQNKSRILVRASGTMIDLRQDEVIWKRIVTMVSAEEYTFEEYKADNSRLLQEQLSTTFNKLASRFSNDIIFSN